MNPTSGCGCSAPNAALGAQWHRSDDRQPLRRHEFGLGEHFSSSTSHPALRE
ncbi:hypothetical protein STXM2123_3790 [Streptomyces sp. F-3]|nr:hypothetical protein STXM2123_3790 [Streptomyces sp. F-3]